MYVGAYIEYINTIISSVESLFHSTSSLNTNISHGIAKQEQ